MAEAISLMPNSTLPKSPSQASRKDSHKTNIITKKSSQDVGVQMKSPEREAKKLAPGKIPPSRVPKTKQTKSRNGCHTCKAKRLKCDETKPTCQNCARRNVECEGYKKEFKWKGFPEQNIGRKLIRDPTTSPSLCSEPAFIDAHLESASASIRQQTEAHPIQPPAPVTTNTSHKAQASTPATTANNGVHESCSSTDNNSRPPSEESSGGSLAQHFSQASPDDSPFTPFSRQVLDMASRSSFAAEYALSFTGGEPLSKDDYHIITSPNSAGTNVSGPDELHWPLPNRDFQDSFGSAMSILSPASLPSSSQSAEYLIHRFFTSTCSIMSIFHSCEIVDNSNTNPWLTLIWPLVQSGDYPMLYHGLLSMSCFHGAQMESSLRSQGLEHMRLSLTLLQENDTWTHLPVEVTLATCLALGFSESWMCWNPEIKSGAGYIKAAKQCILHALNNGAENKAHKRQLRFLCKTYLYFDVISRLTSIDTDVSNDAFDSIAMEVLSKSKRQDLSSKDTQLNGLNAIQQCREGFSYNNNILPQPPRVLSKPDMDPLMGSASTLFPIIGRVANLVRRVCKSSVSTPSIISTAVDLKQQLEAWSYGTGTVPGALYEEANHTAEAYRLATILHLCQSVPELLPCNQLLSSFSTAMGLEILNYLARIPPTSGTLIVQIYPLLVGGCEVISDEDRSWVRERWATMESKMGIGNVEKAKEVVLEVWKRRDKAMRPITSFNARQLPELPFSWDDGMFYGDMSGPKSDDSIEPAQPWTEEYSFDDTFNPSGVGCDDLDGVNCFGNVDLMSISGGDEMSSGYVMNELDYAVRGKLHWVGVMKEWGWEVLLG